MTTRRGLGNDGFTIIELVMTIVILAILALIAIPQYFNLTNNANASSEAGVAGGVRSGIYTYFANFHTFPTALDAASNAACTTGNACFGNIMSQGAVRSQWTKVSTTQYTGPTGATFTYTPASGAFQ